MTYPVNSFRRVTATGTVKSGPGVVKSVTFGSTAAASNLVLRDGGAGGTVMMEIGSASGAAFYGDYNFPFTTDLHATLSGAAASLTVEFE